MSKETRGGLVINQSPKACHQKQWRDYLMSITLPEDPGLDLSRASPDTVTPPMEVARGSALGHAPRQFSYLIICV